VFFQQLADCQYEVAPGPGKLLRWSVPAGVGTNDVGATGRSPVHCGRSPVHRGQPPRHDDLLMSAALCAVLDTVTWSTGGSGLIQGRDPLLEEKGY
jgi:hypothetical protein